MNWRRWISSAGLRTTAFLALAAGSGLAVTAQNGQDSTAPKTPYTIAYGTVSVRTLADGTTITHKTRQILSQDSEGRTFFSITEREGQRLVTRVNIQDPVAQTRTSWTDPGDTATVTRFLPASGTGAPDCMLVLSTPSNATDEPEPEDADRRGVVGKLVGGAMSATSPYAPRNTFQRPTVSGSVEDLGVQFIQGIEAHGTRITQTTPKGVAGNNEPLVRVEETWRATDPGLESLLLQTQRNDPQFGTNKQETLSVSLSEPDVSSFQPPANYQLVTVDLHQVPCPAPHPLASPVR
jgi:hypothetical protein